MGSLLQSLARRLPATAVGAANEFQYKHPAFGRPIRWIADRAAAGPTVIAKGEAAGLRIDATGFRAGYALGTSDPDEQAWLARSVRRGDVLCDVGAAIGFFTLIGSRLVGDTGSVTAFEPLVGNIERLRANVTMNALANVEIVEAAVAAVSGVGLFGTAGEWDQAKLGAGDMEVTVVSLDDHFAGKRAPDVLKIDAEGSEIEVLRGAAGILSTTGPRILVEVHWLGPDFTDFVERELAPIGYTARKLSGAPLDGAIERYHAVLTADHH